MDRLFYFVLRRAELRLCLTVIKTRCYFHHV
jgi:hypothetical protein